jgi:signal transduction histidine kinase
MVSAEMLVDECAAAGLAEATDLARGVVDASERLRGLTEDLLTIARLEQGAAPERSVFAIDAVLEEVAQRVRVAAASVDVAVQVRVDVEPGPASGPVKRTRSEGAGALEVVADPEWIRRVVQNLVDNAVKYAPRDSPIRIRARAHSNGGPGHDRDQVLITITDYGLQIPEEQRARIFHKFAQVPLRSRRGSGLGLAFCRLAVRAHGGDIWITDANDDGGDGAADDDAGTTFAFTLPRAAS